MSNSSVHNDNASLRAGAGPGKGGARFAPSVRRSEVEGLAARTAAASIASGRVR